MAYKRRALAAIVTIQKNVRMFLLRKTYRRKLSAVNRIQVTTVKLAICLRMPQKRVRKSGRIPPTRSLIIQSV